MSASKLAYFVARGERLALDSAARADLRGSYAKLSDGVTHYELAGPDDGELVFLVPGLTIPLFYWDALASALHEKGFRTLAYSAYGRGYSDRVKTTYCPRLFLRQARELLEHLGLLREVRHLMGTSLGALIAMALLQEDWFRTETLTLIGPAGLESRLPLPARLARVKGVGRLVGTYFGQRGVVGHLHRNVRTSEDADRLRAMVGAAFQYEGSIYALFSTLSAYPIINQQELYRQTGELGIPTLLAWGMDDLVTPISGMPSVRALLNPTEAHVIEECGHMAPFERPEQVALLFTRFYARVYTDHLLPGSKIGDRCGGIQA